MLTAHTCMPPMQLLMALDHPNIVRCHEAFVSEGKLCIVMDYCSQGEPAQKASVILA